MKFITKISLISALLFSVNASAFWGNNGFNPMDSFWGNNNNQYHPNYNYNQAPNRYGNYNNGYNGRQNYRNKSDGYFDGEAIGDAFGMNDFFGNGMGDMDLDMDMDMDLKFRMKMDGDVRAENQYKGQGRTNGKAYGYADQYYNNGNSWSGNSKQQHYNTYAPYGYQQRQMPRR